MKLSQLFKDFKGLDVDINGIKTNSNDIDNGDLFVCIKGAYVDRHDFIDDAIKAGAKALITSKDVNVSIPYIKVENPDKELIRILEIFYHNPLDKLTLIGITGTDGKTTTAKIIQQLIGNYICGYIGTLGADSKYFHEKTGNTTPSIEKLYYLFNKFVENNIKYVVMETSSEAFFYHRLNGIVFDIGCLTNITSEHLNTHKTLENYIECKKQLFISSKLQLLNSNDLHFEEIKEISNNYKTYGFNKNDDLIINSYKLYPNKTDINLSYKEKTYEIDSNLVGKFNVENLSLAVLVLTCLNFDINNIVEKCKYLEISGRMQAIKANQDFYCIVDYAHTTNAVKNVLEFAKTLNVNKIITVIGQAGGRDQLKRKEVGKIALELSDFVYLTSDDPRYENVEDIIAMMLDDTDKTNYKIVTDRSKAIEEAVLLANKHDLVLCLGKGTDPYQKVQDYEIKYLETDEVLKAIKKKYQE